LRCIVVFYRRRDTCLNGVFSPLHLRKRFAQKGSHFRGYGQRGGEHEWFAGIALKTNTAEFAGSPSSKYENETNSLALKLQAIKSAIN
jgi:hypothetical protein